MATSDSKPPPHFRLVQGTKQDDLAVFAELLPALEHARDSLPLESDHIILVAHWAKHVRRTIARG